MLGIHQEIKPMTTAIRTSIDSLVIEVTRRCNMQCPHCLRGEPECVDIDLDYVEKLFDQIDQIDSITFSGGEPSLVPDKIRGIISLAKKHGVSFGNFYIATNAQDISDNFLMVVLELYCYCYNNELSSLEYSNDKFHDEVDQSNIRKIKAFSFGKDRDSGLNEQSLINLGRAADNYGGRTLKLYKGEADGEHIYGDLYLNCKGNLVPSCDMSYLAQDRYIICHVDHPCIMEAVIDYYENGMKDEALDDGSIEVCEYDEDD
jgi:organic radical activating enzyme